MQHDLKNMIDPITLRKWKKRLLIGGAVAVTLALASCGAGVYGLYVLGQKVDTQVDITRVEEALPNFKEVSFGPITGVAVNVASAWAEAAIAGGEAQNVKQVLGCVDALGGPNAGKVLETLASRATNADAAGAMRRVAAELSNGGTANSATCIGMMAG